MTIIAWLYKPSMINIIFLFFLQEIIQRVKNLEEPPFRPTVPNRIEKDKNEELYKLMKDCWVEEPNIRPDFNEISKSVHKMVANQGM